MHLLRSTSQESRMIERNTGEVLGSASGGAVVLITLKVSKIDFWAALRRLIAKAPKTMHSSVPF